MDAHLIAELGDELFNALQRRETTFGQIYAMSASCGIDARRVLADHFQRGASHG